ncbi:Branched-chain-amino-acid aminotransferase-like protein 3, chloroplastic [Auxenochlorella protothecoides]|uniref:Branched-chain-amino-acid aminotransferase-like protein 3, chloroplastic n=1 Tax=Auxenochlorella protothecoides TaxID=3075 RepID=A0A087SGU5_AUXPR|nr:Branched-chain-amino-acid aminotransferase-like protein 3, chloroplastic [Auxenochlorella protothecoides]KFM24949.1 Branched-chain-amino-acid aminotransferase-like protein 3, chloroplastic [Auxenochlorella protothecoides]RMZ52820.1 hypothetical protein APUTEX25_000939 [Auxenochlorella protothecoides]|eukprot:RMZ52820.1 hypothetical protein APUTEX25_000939 [Auxenochlorella protothecoides]
MHETSLPIPPPQAIEAMYARQSRWQRERAAAFFSSELGGIVTDPALMLLHADEHGFHRGHAVYETLRLEDGHIYLLKRHLQRLFLSMVKADIPLAPDLGVDQMARTVLETAAASTKLSGTIKVIACAGRDDLGLAGTTCAASSFYVLVSSTAPLPKSKEEEYLRGWHVKTSPVPAIPDYFATLRSVGNLAVVLSQHDAEAGGFDMGIMQDGQGNVAAAPGSNVACLTQDGVLVVPPFDRCLADATTERMLELLPQAIRSGMEGISAVEQRHISIAEAKKCIEVMLVGGDPVLMPVRKWDDEQIADGQAGIVALQIRVMLLDDMDPHAEHAALDTHLPVPYGGLTGMGL